MPDCNAAAAIDTGPVPGGAAMPWWWLRNLSITAKLAVIVGTLTAAIVAVLAFAVFSSYINTGVRAYVGGEGRYSNGQRDAVFFLTRYARYHDEKDYQKYQQAIAMPLGDRQARLELQKPSFDYSVAAQGFVGGGNAVEDVPNLISVFRRFQSVSYLAHAIRLWAEGDALIAELARCGSELHDAIIAGTLDQAREAELLNRIERINATVTPLEHEFSQVLGESARLIWSALLGALLLLFATLLTTGLWIAWRISRQLRASILDLRAGAMRVAAGDLSHPIEVRSSDELGALTSVLNDMIAQRRHYEASLHEARELAQLTLSSIGDGVIRTDNRGVITFCNQAAAKLLETDPEYPLQKAFGELIHLSDDGGRPIADPVARVLQSGAALRLSLFSTIRTVQGKHLPVADSVAPVRDQNGAVIGTVFVFQDVSDTRQMTEKLAFQARHDQLTGLPNRFAFEEALQACLASAASKGEIHLLLYIDLDHFKIVNDTCGHAAGDKLLREVSALLRSRLRPSDYLARLGGDEFAVLLYGSSTAAANRVAENLIQAVKDYHLFYDGRTFKAGLSVGISEINAGNCDGSAVMAQADTACYTAKDLGRGRCQVYRTDDAQIMHARRNMDWSQRIEHALDANRFEVYLQKIVDRERAMVGFEALIRMQGDEGRVIGPDAFLPAAKRMGLMVRIDQWMAREVLELVHHRKIGPNPDDKFYISINLSAKSAGEPAFVDWMLALIDQYSIGKELLRFEITETEQLQATETESRLVTELRQRGFKVWLDDFGMGYNSFDLLKRMAVDGLKIDRSFTGDLLRDPVDRALVEAIVSIGNAMNLELLAEGVEDEEAYRALAGMGIHYFQGHLFDKAGAAALAIG